MNYYSVNKYIKERFGQKLYKLSLDGGFTCPNRDGKLGTGGCIFCSAAGSGDFAASANLSISEKIEQGKRQLEHKVKEDSPKYIAYFQAFTNSYAPVEKLRKLYLEALSHPDVAALSIATRPDCLPPKVIELLADIQEIKPVWVELGLQTIHPEIARYIRRGYELEVYDEAVKNLAAIGIEQIITHLILGLPGENHEMMLESVDYVAQSQTNGIKLQLLHVLRNTDLAKDYEAGKFRTLEIEEYCDLVVSALQRLPKDMVVHRITGDGSWRDLIAPRWSTDKWRILNTINQKLNKAE